MLLLLSGWWVAIRSLYYLKIASVMPIAKYLNLLVITIGNEGLTLRFAYRFLQTVVG